ncbi:Retrovirus-related Pol polyprotein from transposon TNT 1-94 [Trichinella patagoniensis]|uniref:Retrovirus-related Pol polyprotein from transposon TNT 1-94 n=1 Tax=Trichinella patagoniensis TaxID=990121 RepID=A0A0V0ZTL5_9BILA|nr:Retrovirus-related Pol polyprotein from transposon TNT 1-94 [Trichinella patagoniensis]
MSAMLTEREAHSFELWHQRLGHITEEKVFCEGCVFGSMTRKPHKEVTERRQSVPGEIIHADVCGPFIHPSIGGYRKVYFMKTKDEVLRCLKIALTEIKQETGRDVQRIRTDRGTEFANRELDNFLTEKKIVHENTPPYTPQCNGMAERENRTLVEKARAMLHTRNLPRCLWAEAVHTAAYLLNRIPNRKETTKTPYEKWFGKRPTVEHLQIFGCDAYVHIPDQHRKKFNRRARKLFLLAMDRKRLVLIDGEEDSWMQTADKDEDDFLEEDITDEKRGPGRPPGSKNKIKMERSVDTKLDLWQKVQTLLAIATDEDLEILQFDVKTAFFHGKIDELIFMEQPPCFNDGSGRICKLQRALYGLKQAPRAWNKRLNDFLLTLNLQRAAADPCLYVSAPGAECRIILGLYVGDGLLCCLSLTVLKELVKKLDAEFEIIVGDPSNFVGLEIYRDRSKRTVAIGQKNYIRRVLLKFNMECCKSVATPGDPLIKLSKDMAPSNDDERNQKQTNISSCLSKVALFAENPGLSHWKAVKRVFRYIKGTEDLKHQLIAFCDSDWAGDADSRRSTVGYIMTFCNGPVALSSRVQKTIALSTVDAEYMALTEGVKEVKSIRQLLMDLGRNQVTPTLLFSDKQSAAFLTKNPQHHRRTKHIDIRYHFIRTEQRQGVVSVEYTPSDKQPADMLTKSLSGPRHLKCRQMLGMNVDPVGSEVVLK